MQLNNALGDSLSVTDQLSLRATATRAGYDHVDLAKVEGSFKVRYPKTIFKHLSARKDAAQGGIVFKPAFASHNIFDGDVFPRHL